MKTLALIVTASIAIAATAVSAKPRDEVLVYANETPASAPARAPRWVDNESGFDPRRAPAPPPPRPIPIATGLCLA